MSSVGLTGHSLHDKTWLFAAFNMLLAAPMSCAGGPHQQVRRGGGPKHKQLRQWCGRTRRGALDLATCCFCGLVGSVRVAEAALHCPWLLTWYLTKGALLPAEQLLIHALHGNDAPSSRTFAFCTCDLTGIRGRLHARGEARQADLGADQRQHWVALGKCWAC